MTTTNTTEQTFPKSKLISIRWRGMPPKIGRYPRRWFMTNRMANARNCYFLFWEIVWRRPWLPCAAYSQGWDACFRQMLGEFQALKEENEKLKNLVNQ